QGRSSRRDRFVCGLGLRGSKAVEGLHGLAGVGSFAGFGAVYGALRHTTHPSQRLLGQVLHPAPKELDHPLRVAPPNGGDHLGVAPYPCGNALAGLTMAVALQTAVSAPHAGPLPESPIRSSALSKAASQGNRSKASEPCPAGWGTQPPSPMSTPTPSAWRAATLLRKGTRPAEAAFTKGWMVTGTPSRMVACRTTRAELSALRAASLVIVLRLGGARSTASAVGERGVFGSRCRLRTGRPVSSSTAPVSKKSTAAGVAITWTRQPRACAGRISRSTCPAGPAAHTTT